VQFAVVALPALGLLEKRQYVAINGLIYIRGQPEDFDHWAQLGNRGWGWDAISPA
jgi:choline dehydrogenase-like flavoprotein